jgi:hypothetical protein
MSKKARSLIAAETNLIRKMLEQNVNCSHQEIMEKIQISRPTYHRYIRRMLTEDSKIWDEVHMDSANYRATRLMDSLFNCIKVFNEIMDSPNAKPDDRMEAARTICEAEANVYKLVLEGPTFKTTIKLPSNESINKQLPN